MAIENKYYEDFQVGEMTRSERFAFSEEELAAYLQLVKDDHAVHRDKEFCRRQFGRPELVIPGCLIQARADSYWAELVSPSDPYCPHYGQDKVRYLARLTCGDQVYCEFRLTDKQLRDQTYGMLVFESYVKKTDGTPVLFVVDKLLVPYRK